MDTEKIYKNVYKVQKDGETVAQFGSENEAFIYLHKNQPNSWEYALNHGGWAIINPFGMKVEA